MKHFADFSFIEIRCDHLNVTVIIVDRTVTIQLRNIRVLVHQSKSACMGSPTIAIKESTYAERSREDNNLNIWWGVPAKKMLALNSNAWNLRAILIDEILNFYMYGKGFRLVCLRMTHCFTISFAIMYLL